MKRKRLSFEFRNKYNEPTTTITYACGHTGEMVTRCAEAYQRHYCLRCAHKKLPKPSACLRDFQARNGDHLGPMLGPIGAVIYQRQRDGIETYIAWSGLELMHDALAGARQSRKPSYFARLFAQAGL